jgi:epoxide hydrolase 4
LGWRSAWVTGIEHPEAVARLVVLNCPHPVVLARALRSNWAQVRRSWYIFAFQLPWLPEWALRRNGARALKDTLRRFTKRAETFSDQLLRAGAKRTAQAADRRAVRPEDYYRAAVRSPVPTGMTKVRASMLLIWGDDDFALGIELTQGMEGLLEHEPRVEHLADTGHFVMEERPEVVNRLLLEFLA